MVPLRLLVLLGVAGLCLSLSPAAQQLLTDLETGVLLGIGDDILSARLKDLGRDNLRKLITEFPAEQRAKWTSLLNLLVGPPKFSTVTMVTTTVGVPVTSNPMTRTLMPTVNPTVVATTNKFQMRTQMVKAAVEKAMKEGAASILQNKIVLNIIHIKLSKKRPDQADIYFKNIGADAVLKQVILEAIAKRKNVPSAVAAILDKALKEGTVDQLLKDPTAVKGLNEQKKLISSTQFKDILKGLKVDDATIKLISRAMAQASKVVVG